LQKCSLELYNRVLAIVRIMFDIA